jgi:hypothetical protein
MPRYVLLNRRAGKFTAEQKIASRAAVATVLTQLEGNSRVIADKDPADDLARRVVVFDADAAEVAKMRSSLPSDAILEPLLRRTLHCKTPIELKRSLPAAAMTAGDAAASRYSVTVKGAGSPLSGIEVMFYVRDPSGQVRTTQATTDNQGRANVTVSPGYVVSFVEPIPYANFWIMLSEAPPSGSTIDCLPIGKAAAGGSGWWHAAMGVDVTAAGRGAGIKVGVIDTGCGPHPNLSHVNLVGTYVDGRARHAHDGHHRRSAEQSRRLCGNGAEF